MQIDVHHVDAEIARPRDAHQRVHIRAVHVDHGALGVQNLRALHDVLFEHAQRVRIRHHQRGHIVIDQARELLQIHHALVVGLDVLHRVARHHRRGRIGAMRGIGNQNPLARIALRFQQRAHQQDARQFAMRARRGLQRHRIQACDLEQRLLQPRDHFHRALRKLSG